MATNVYCHGLPTTYEDAARANVGMRENIAMRAFALVQSEEDILVLPRDPAVEAYIAFMRQVTEFSPHIWWTSGDHFTLEEDLLAEYGQALSSLSANGGVVFHNYLPSVGSADLTNAVHGSSIVGPHRQDTALFGTKTALHLTMHAPGAKCLGQSPGIPVVPGYTVSHEGGALAAAQELRERYPRNPFLVRVKEANSISGSGQRVVEVGPGHTRELTEGLAFPLVIEVEVIARRSVSVQYGVVGGDVQVWGYTEQVFYDDGIKWRGNCSLDDSALERRLHNIGASDARHLAAYHVNALAGMDIIQVRDDRFHERLFMVERNLRVTGAHIQHGLLRMLNCPDFPYYAAFIGIPPSVSFGDFVSALDRRGIVLQKDGTRGVTLTSFAPGIAGVMAVASTRADAEALFLEVEREWMH
ncbi:MAG: hypothetical protein Q7S89_02835 [bacterium]|nr:hypothetical protein [bacterium]